MNESGLLRTPDQLKTERQAALAHNLRRSIGRCARIDLRLNGAARRRAQAIRFRTPENREVVFHGLGARRDRPPTSSAIRSLPRSDGHPALLRSRVDDG
jgi:hypothetical protein